MLSEGYPVPQFNTQTEIDGRLLLSTSMIFTWHSPSPTIISEHVYKESKGSLLHGWTNPAKGCPDAAY